MATKSIDTETLSTSKIKVVKINHGQSKLRLFLTKLSGAFMLPIAIMSVTGLFLGVGSYIASTLGETNSQWKIVGQLISNLGKPVFQAMPILFAAAIAVTFTESAGISVFSAVIGFITFSLLQSTFIVEKVEANGADNPMPHFLFDRGFELTNAKSIYNEVLGIKTLNTGIFGGIIVGAISSFIFNAFHTIEIGGIFSVISGRRFPVIITIFVMLPLSVLFVVAWPYVAYGIEKLASVINNLNKEGSVTNKYVLPELITGFVSRLLMPFGLQNIFSADIFAKVAEVKTGNSFSFSQGEYPIAIMGLPAVSLAMIATAPKGKKSSTLGIVLPATITSFITGITEPLEFMFLFLSPFVFIFFHGVIVGMSYMIMAHFQANIWETNSLISQTPNSIDQTSPFVGGGALDLISSIIDPKKASEKWWLIFALGQILATIYFFGFCLFIKLFNISTPGRNADLKVSNAQMESKAARASVSKLPLAQQELLYRIRAEDKEKMTLITNKQEEIYVREKNAAARIIQKQEIDKLQEDIRDLKMMSSEELIKIRNANQAAKEAAAAMEKADRALAKANLTKKATTKKAIRAEKAAAKKSAIKKAAAKHVADAKKAAKEAEKIALQKNREVQELTGLIDIKQKRTKKK